VQAGLSRNPRSAAVTQFHEFPGRSHLPLVEEGWEAVTGYIGDWLDRSLETAPPAYKPVRG
jgi:hypothetical protein